MRLVLYTGTYQDSGHGIEQGLRTEFGLGHGEVSLLG